MADLGPGGDHFQALNEVAEDTGAPVDIIESEAAASDEDGFANLTKQAALNILYKARIESLEQKLHNQWQPTWSQERKKEASMQFKKMQDDSAMKITVSFASLEYNVEQRNGKEAQTALNEYSLAMFAHMQLTSRISASKENHYKEMSRYRRKKQEEAESLWKAAVHALLSVTGGTSSADQVLAWSGGYISLQSTAETLRTLADDRQALPAEIPDDVVNDETIVGARARAIAQLSRYSTWTEGLIDKLNKDIEYLETKNSDLLEGLKSNDLVLPSIDTDRVPPETTGELEREALHSRRRWESYEKKFNAISDTYMLMEQGKDEEIKTLKEDRDNWQERFNFKSDNETGGQPTYEELDTIRKERDGYAKELEKLEVEANRLDKEVEEGGSFRRTLVRKIDSLEERAGTYETEIEDLNEKIEDLIEEKKKSDTRTKSLVNGTVNDRDRFNRTMVTYQKTISDLEDLLEEQKSGGDEKDEIIRLEALNAGLDAEVRDLKLERNTLMAEAQTAAAREQERKNDSENRIRELTKLVDQQQDLLKEHEKSAVASTARTDLLTQETESLRAENTTLGAQLGAAVAAAALLISPPPQPPTSSDAIGQDGGTGTKRPADGPTGSEPDPKIPKIEDGAMVGTEAAAGPEVPAVPAETAEAATEKDTRSELGAVEAEEEAAATAAEEAEAATPEAIAAAAEAERKAAVAKARKEKAAATRAKNKRKRDADEALLIMASVGGPARGTRARARMAAAAAPAAAAAAPVVEAPIVAPADEAGGGDEDEDTDGFSG